MAPLDKELMGILACPACKTALEYRAEESVLSCARCRRHYLVVDGIPNMIIEQAKIV